MAELAPRRVAVVTGASAGIGLSFSRRLAARGWDVVLVARDRARLDALAAELERTHGVHTEVLVADLTDEQGVAAAERRLADPERPVELLVNNAGFVTYGRFAELDIDREQQEIELNVIALVRLAHAALGPMILRRNGTIVNVSSIAGNQPTPKSATYGATKAYVTSFTHALHEEARRSGVNVMVLCPGFTHTELHTRSGLGPTRLPAFLWQTADQVVDAALRDVDRGRAACTPGILNQMLTVLGNISPPGLARRVAARLTDLTG